MTNKTTFLQENAAGGDCVKYDNPQNSSMLLVYCLFCQETCGYNDSDVVKSSKNDIDNFIYGLVYSREILAYRGGSKYSVPVMKEGKVDDEKNFIVITREKKTAENGRSDIGVVTSQEHRTFPGSLLLANQRLMDNMPDVLAVDRAPITYTINLPGLAEESSFTIVPSFAEYQSSREKALKTWFNKHWNDDNVIANFQSENSFAYSKELLRVKFGLEFARTDVESSIDFNAMKNLKKLIMIYKFKQVFYTVSTEPTKKPSDLFRSGVTVEELQRKVNSDNPPIMVDSVSYGRTLYVRIETTSTDEEAKGLLSKKLPLYKVSTDLEQEIKNKLRNLNLQVYIVGGTTDHTEMIKAQSLTEVSNIILQYGKFSKSNLGYPVSFSAEFIRDNAIAAVTMNTDYYETTRTVRSKGILKLVHKGWFVMKWYVTWKEVTYNEGEEELKEVSWSGNAYARSAPFERELELPGNAVDIHVVAKVDKGNWEGYRTILDRSGIPLVDQREFSVWGTASGPKYKINPPF